MSISSKALSLLALGLLALSLGCAAPVAVPTAVPTSTPFPIQTPGLPATSTPPACRPAPIQVPTVPAVIPPYAELDETTGLHVIGPHVEIDLATYRLEVSGLVSTPLSLTYDEIRCLPVIHATPTLVCPQVFIDYPDFTGASLNAVLDLAGPLPGAAELVLTGADGYTAVLILADARNPENYLAYKWKDEPLPILHGFPLRGVFPAQEGNKWVMWLVKIEVR